MKFDKITHNIKLRKTTKNEFTGKIVKQQKIKLQKDSSYKLTNNSTNTRTENFMWNEFNNYYCVGAENESSGNNNKFNEWVSATKVKNYLMKDPLLDWLDLYYLKKEYNEQSSNLDITVIEKNISEERNNLIPLFEMGNKFENNIMDNLKTKYPNSIKKVVSSNNVTIQSSEITLQYMKEGIPIIEQAAIYNIKNKTFGVADIIIRSDWINKLFKQQVLENHEVNIKANNLNSSDNYHYLVIDIKWTTMYLCSDGKTLRNNNLFPAYKGQLAIYNAGLGIMQGYTPNQAYILSKSWNINNGFQIGHNCFDRLGIIDFIGFDKNYIKETHNAITWIRNVRLNGENWSCNAPHISELYPNMCNTYDSPYHTIKKNLANKLNELTDIWMVGVKNRKIGHKNNIYSWKISNCNAKKLGIHGKKIGLIIDEIIKINRSSNILIKPKIINNNSFNWKQSSELDFYIDFENINYCFWPYKSNNINNENNRNNGQILFLIGIGYEENNIWKYNKFIINTINNNEESIMINDFINFMEDKRKKYILKYNQDAKIRLFHWSHAEKSMFESLDVRHNYKFNNWKNSVIWIDMCKIFIDEPIVINGAKKFGIKEIAKSMKLHGLILSDWESNGPSDGLSAMFNAIEYYKFINNYNNSNKDIYEYKKNMQIMESIINYNEIDCKVIYEIVAYLRKYH